MSAPPPSNKPASDIHVSIEIAVPPARLFEIFVGDIDRWWRRGPEYRFFPPWEGEIRFEQNGTTRLVHRDGEDPARRHVIGEVTCWQPGERLSFTFRLPNFTADQETQVDIRFTPTGEGTRLELTHTGWDSLPPDHPALHGLAGHRLMMMKAQIWARNFESLKARAGDIIEND